MFAVNAIDVLGALDDWERKIVDDMRTLASSFAQRAESYDRLGKFPDENFRALADAGMLALLVPREYGGRELSTLAYMACLYEMAKGDTSTALAYNMHATTLSALRHLADESQKQRWFSTVVHHGKRIAALGSEAGLKPFTTGQLPKAHISEHAGNLRLSGRKSYGSFGPNADMYYVTATFEGQAVAVMVDAASEGIEPQDDWNVMSMRATTSVSIDFHDVLILPENIVRSDSQATTLLFEMEYALGYPAVYLGAADVAYTAAREAVKKTPEGYMIAQLGDMRLRMQAAWLMAQHAAASGGIGSFTRAAAIAAAKAVACETACEICSQAIRIVGGRALSLTSPVQRVFRDVQAGPVMAFTPDQVRAMIGMLEIGHAPDFVAELQAQPTPNLHRSN